MKETITSEGEQSKVHGAIVFLVAAFVFCIPFGDFHAPGAAAFLSVSKVCFILLACAAAAGRLWRRLRLFAVDAWTVVLLAGAAVSAVNSVSAAAVLFNWLRLAGLTALFFICRAVLWDERAFRAAAAAFAAAGFLMGVLGLVQTLLGATLPGVGIYGPYQSLVPVGGTAAGGAAVYRAAGAFSHPNELGFFLVAALAATFALLIGSASGRLWKALLGAALAVESAAVVYTFSRSAWAGVAVVCVAAFFLYGARRAAGWVALAALAAAAAVAALPDEGRRAVFSRASERQPYDAGRLWSWRAAAGMAAAHPFAGVGLGTFAERFEEFMPAGAARDAWQRNDAHNTILALAAEAGVPAACGMLCGIAAALIAAWRRRRSAAGGVAPAALAGMLPALMLNSFQYQEALWLMLAAAQAVLPPAESGRNAKRPAGRAAVSAALIALVLASAAALVWRAALWPARGLAGRLLLPGRSPLAEFGARHPRIYLGPELLEQLRRRALDETDLPLVRLREWLEENSDNLESVAADEDLRQLARTVPPFALAALVFGSDAHLAAALERAELLRKRLVSEPEQSEINRAESIYALSLLLDWFYDEMPEEQRGKFFEAIASGAEHVSSRMVIFPPLNNHRAVDAASLGVAGMVCYGHLPQAGRWLAAASRELEYISRFFSDDGVSPEGAAYSAYTAEYLLKYYAAAGPLLNEPLRPKAWLRAWPQAMLHQALPVEEWSAKQTVMSFGDCPRQAWHGPGYINSFLAREFGDPLAQWLAREFMARRADGESSALWLYALWHDSSLEAAGPETLGLSVYKYFDNWGMYFMRDSWTGSGAMAAFKCSPAGGRKLRRGGFRYPGLGHAQPDANSFQVFAFGEYLVAHPGLSWRKLSADHNTVLVNGRGQLGEGAKWLDGRAAFQRRKAADIVFATNRPEYDYVVGEAAADYPEGTLNKFTRHFFRLRGGALVVCDELEPGADSVLTWLLHSDADWAQVDERTMRFDKPRASLFVRFMAPARARLICRRVRPEGSPKWGIGEWTELAAEFDAGIGVRVICLAVLLPVPASAAADGFPAPAARAALRAFVEAGVEEGALSVEAMAKIRKYEQE